VRSSDNSAFLSAFLNIQNALPVELQAFQQTDNGHVIAKRLVVEGSWNRNMRLKIEKIRMGRDGLRLTAKSIDSLPEKGGLMNTKKIHGKNNATRTEWASYFGLVVEITLRMTNYSLIRWRDREFIVETGDLLMAQRRAA
jgi:hypothetical protein